MLFEVIKGYFAERFAWNEALVIRIEVGSVLALILLVLNLLFHFSAAQADEMSGTLNDTLVSFRSASGSLSVVTNAQLYAELSHASRASRHRIYTMYLGMVPPADSSLPEKLDYFAEILKLPKQKRQVVFRRIVLFSDSNRPWIREMARQYAGLANVSLAVYRRPEHAAQPLSIQLFDQERVFIVRAGARPPGQPRDIIVNDSIVVSLFDDYYSELWNQADVIVDSGRPVDHALAALG